MQRETRTCSSSLVCQQNTVANPCPPPSRDYFLLRLLMQEAVIVDGDPACLDQLEGRINCLLGLDITQATKNARNFSYITQVHTAPLSGTRLSI